MAASHPSAACCTTTAIIGPPYTPKGEFIEVDHTKVYTVGPEHATKALFICYDIFGYSGQILEGADKLAEQYKIFMPDFFEGSPAPLEWMPLDGPEDMERIDAFTSGPGETNKTVKRIGELRQNFQDMCPEIERWGLVGYCWSGYVAPFALGRDTPFSACATCHPGFPESEFASKVSVPLLSLCSKDEPESEYVDFKPALKVESRFEHFPGMVHGWMSARGNLGEEEVRKDFDRGYEMILEWFGVYL